MKKIIVTIILLLINNITFAKLENIKKIDYTPTKNDYSIINNFYKQVSNSSKLEEKILSLVKNEKNIQRMKKQFQFILYRLYEKILLKNSVHSDYDLNTSYNSKAFNYNETDYTITDIFWSREFYGGSLGLPYETNIGDFFITIKYKYKGELNNKFCIEGGKYNIPYYNLPTDNYFYQNNQGKDNNGYKTKIINFKINAIDGYDLKLFIKKNGTIKDIFSKNYKDEKLELLDLDKTYIPNILTISDKYSIWQHKDTKKLLKNKNCSSIDSCEYMIDSYKIGIIKENMPQWMFDKIKNKKGYELKISNSNLGNFYCMENELEKRCLWISDGRVNNITNYYK